MAQYRLTWEIDIEASGPVEAARQALTIQRDRESTATVFTVRNFKSGATVDVDLSKWTHNASVAAKLKGGR